MLNISKRHVSEKYFMMMISYALIAMIFDRNRPQDCYNEEFMIHRGLNNLITNPIINNEMHFDVGIR